MLCDGDCGDCCLYGLFGMYCVVDCICEVCVVDGL